MVHSACRKSLFATRGAGIHRRPSRFPCALHPETGGATGRKNLFFPLPLFSELVKVLKIFDFNGAGHPSWVSRTHPFFPSRKSPLAALRLFPLLGFPAHTLHPQGVCSIRKAAQPLTAALPYRRGEFTTLSTVLSVLRSEDAFLYAESCSALSAEPNCGEKRKHSFKESGKTCELRRIP